MMRHGKWIPSGVVLALAIGLGATPALAQFGSSSIGGCGVIGFDAHTAGVAISTVGGNTQVGTLSVGLPCDGLPIMNFTAELSAANSSILSLFVVATCIAPAVTNGCTVSAVPLAPPVPDGYSLVSNTGALAAETHTATAIFLGLPRGHYRFDAFISNGIVAVSATAGRRIFTIQSAGSPPVTAPGSTQ